MERRFVLAAGLALLLCGCLDPAEPVPDMQSLSRFLDCDFTYPDGSPVPCEDHAVSLAYQSDLGAGWVCTGQHGFPDAMFRTYWNPATQRHALGWVYREDAVPFSGIAFLEGSQDGLVRFSSDAEAGHSVLPAGWVGRVVSGFYTTSLDVQGQALGGAVLHELWSVYDDYDWLIFRVDAGEQRYHFDAMVELPFGPEPGPINVEGDDFRVDIRFRDSGLFSYGLSTAPHPACLNQ